MRVIRIVPNLSSEAFVASRDFYAAMFDLVVSVELDDWYLQLMAESDTMLNIGFVKPDHELFAGRTARSPPRFATKSMASAISWWSTPTGWC
jgi:hypothetical protein